LTEVRQKIMLDVGCGENKQKGYIGMDRRDVKGVDIVHDAEVFPWPLEDESCAVVIMSHLIEHIKPWLRIDVLNECWRILEHDGLLMIATPHAMSFGMSQDPTHIAPGWNEATPSYFDPGDPSHLYTIYRPKPWKVEKLAYDPRADLEVAFRKREDDVNFPYGGESDQ
jgi:SAM-dependent methyltransferase